ncbi:mandelate racemase/muconate lactonizing enzyme family protein [Acuticoccus sediminis]|uniref:mandelate racemase/muconate lactonizing enzyme family protein n=1 Tax=Acuticoccus sediminis TaxID=2184697 RepID=UPI001CFE8BB0|nr:mandelate racemase/muconate lactonizing enzyme family protein [Acuticoccus sediminis]
MGEAERIVRIEGFALACDMPQEAGNALRTFRERQSLLIRITTAGGLVGWGETWAFPAAAAAFIRSVLAPVVLGADATRPRKVQADMLRRVVPDRRGQAHMALSAIDIALWDAFGRAAGMPVSALLGGALRDRLLAYASGPLMPAGADRFAGLEGAVEGFAADGFRAVKLRVGAGLAADERAIRTARRILGPDADLMIDLNEGSTVHDALALAAQVADVGLRWIEEPVPHDDLPAYRDIAARLPVPLAGGESFCGAGAFREAAATRALSILQPDIALTGGITEVMRVAGLGDAFGVPVIPHVWGAGVNFLAGLQVAAVVATPPGARPLPLFEYDTSHNPLRAAVIDPKPDADGTIPVPDGPGLGLAIEPDRLAPYVRDHWTVEE